MNKPIDSAYLLRQMKAFFKNIVKPFVADELSTYSLASEAGYELGLSIDPSTYVMTLELKNKVGTVLSSKEIDFPLESMVVDVDYADGKLTMTLQNGTTADVDVSALVGGLVNDTFTIAGIDMKDDITAAELRIALGIPVDAVFTDTWRPLGTGATDACAGNDVRLSDARVANGGNADTVGGHTVAKDVPSNAVFTDTNTWRPLGNTADTACAGNDSRLTNSRPASDVYAWAKASSKPSYAWSEITGKPTLGTQVTYSLSGTTLTITTK